MSRLTRTDLHRLAEATALEAEKSKLASERAQLSAGQLADALRSPAPEPDPPRTDPTLPHRYQPSEGTRSCRVCGEGPGFWLHARPAPEPTPDPAPTPWPRPGSEPEPRPRPTPEPSGSAPVARVTYQLDGGAPVVFVLPALSWADEDGWSHAGGRIGGLPIEIETWWDRWDDAPGEYRTTVSVANAYQDTGILQFDSLRIEVGGALLLDTGSFPMLPGWSVVRRRQPATFDPHEWAAARSGLSWLDWSEEQAEKMILDNKHGRRTIGPYRLWFNLTPNAPSGEGVAPGFGGLEDWLAGPQGRALREHELLMESQKGPLWLLNRNGTHYQPSKAVWAGHGTTKDVVAPGYLVEPETAQEHQLFGLGAPDLDHSGRQHRLAFALAEYDSFARDVGLLWWARIERQFTLRPTPMPPVGLPLNASLATMIEWSRPGGPFAPPKPNGWANRGFANVLLVHAWSAEYRDPEDVGAHTEALWTLWSQITDALGLADRGGGGDTEPYEDPPWRIRQPAALGFQAELVEIAMREVGRVLGDTRWTDAADKLGAALTVRPPYCYEAGVPEGPSTTVFEGRRHSAMAKDPVTGAAIPEGLKTALVDPGYDRWRAPQTGWVNQFGSWAAAQVHAKQRGLETNQPMETTPRSMWESGVVTPL